MKKLFFSGAVIIYAIFLAAIFTSEVYYRLGIADRAVFFNPFNAEYRDAAHQIKKAIELDPLTPAYHMYYGLSLLEDFPPDKFSAHLQLRLAKQELSRASRLKPYSELYQKTYLDYSAWIDSQL